MTSGRTEALSDLKLEFFVKINDNLRKAQFICEYVIANEVQFSTVSQQKGKNRNFSYSVFVLSFWSKLYYSLYFLQLPRPYHWKIYFRGTDENPLCIFLPLVSRTSIDSKYRKNTLFFIYDGTFLECVVWSTNMYYSHSVFNFAGKPCIISQIELLEYFSWIFKANVKS